MAIQPYIINQSINRPAGPANANLVVLPGERRREVGKETDKKKRRKKAVYRTDKDGRASSLTHRLDGLERRGSGRGAPNESQEVPGHVVFTEPVRLGQLPRERERNKLRQDETETETNIKEKKRREKNGHASHKSDAVSSHATTLKPGRAPAASRAGLRFSSGAGTVRQDFGGETGLGGAHASTREHTRGAGGPNFLRWFDITSVTVPFGWAS